MASRIITPNKGFQENFLRSPATIAIGGGAAGAGKTFASLLDPLHYATRVRGYTAVYFRRNITDIKAPGGLWQESQGLYIPIKGRPDHTNLTWKWHGAGLLKMSHLQHEHSVYAWQGSQICGEYFDELTHFSAEQFWYMRSRNRSVCGVRPYVRATTNPDADSWVAVLIEWWIDQETGYIIDERSGQLRWLVRLDNELCWASSKAEALEKYGKKSLAWDHPKQVKPFSVTFIKGTLDGNPQLMTANPEYLATLEGMSRVERARLLDGNWKIRRTSGCYFNREEVRMIDQVMKPVKRWVRRWDLAASKPSEQYPDPDGTAGILMGEYVHGGYVIADLRHIREGSAKVRQTVINVATQDPEKTIIAIPQDPGQAGKEQIESYERLLKDNGFRLTRDKESGSKEDRADPFAAAWQSGKVDVVKGAWNATLFKELEAFPHPKVHDDVVDACSGAFALLRKPLSLMDVL